MTLSDRKKAILDAASRLFAHYGHAKMTMADVAREANVAVGSVYNEFASKEAIIEEISGGAHVEVLEAMRRAAHVKSRADFGERFTAVLVARTTSFAALRGRGQHACELFYCKASGVASAHQRFREEERLILRELVEQGIDEGEVDPRDVRKTAALVQRALSSLSPPYLYASDEDLASVTSDMAELLLGGLLARGAPKAKKLRRRS